MVSHGFETYLIDNPLKKTVRRDCLLGFTYENIERRFILELADGTNEKVIIFVGIDPVSKNETLTPTLSIDDSILAR